MPDDAPALEPIAPRDLVIELALALRGGDRIHKRNAGEIMSDIVAERLAQRLYDAGFVVMRRVVRHGNVSGSYAGPPDAEAG